LADPESATATTVASPSDARDRRALVTALALAAAAAGAFLAFAWAADVHDPRISPDGDSYVSVLRYLAGETDSVRLLRLSRPGVPALALLWSDAVDPVSAFLVTNALLFVVLVGVFFRLARELLGDPRGAFQASLLLICAFPVYYRGINVTVDLASWLIFVTTAVAILHFTRAGRFDRKVALAMSLGCAVGTLVTELVLVSLVLIALEYFFQHRTVMSFRSLLGDVTTIFLVFGVPVLLYQLAFAYAFDFSLLDNFGAKLIMARAVPYSLGPLGLLRTLVATFSASLLLVPLGLYDLRRGAPHRRLVASMTIACVATLLTVYISSVRFAFVLFPVVFPLAVRGARTLADSSGAGRWLASLCIGAVCGFNGLLYVALLRVDTTEELARRFVPFLIE